MSPFVRVSNWGYWTELDGERLSKMPQGQRLRVGLPSGVQDGLLVVERVTHGGVGGCGGGLDEVTTYMEYIEFEHLGASARILITNKMVGEKMPTKEGEA